MKENLWVAVHADVAWGWEKHSSVKLIGEDSNGRAHSLGCGKIRIMALYTILSMNQGKDALLWKYR